MTLFNTMASNVIKISRVSPVTDAVDPIILPLTVFDLMWLQLKPTRCVSFYRLSESESSRESFYSAMLPKLEQSLSLVLAHFLPLCGHLKWGPQDLKPNLVIFPQEDAVSLTVAETDADFSSVSSKGLRPEAELRALVPELSISSDSASVLSLQITLFPNQGFCIGATSHHAVMDGKTAGQVPNAWAYICKHGTIPKEFQLPTVLDRTFINLPFGLEWKAFALLSYLAGGIEKARTLKLPPARDPDDDLVRITLELTQENVEKLRERGKSESNRSDLHLSTFVVTCAHVLTCMMKAQGGEADRPVCFMYMVDCRDRFDPPVPETYFGNCVFPIGLYGYEAKTFLGEDGFVKAAEILSDSVKGLRSQGVEETWKGLEEGMRSMKFGTQRYGVSGSNHLGMYGSDYGWGRPVNTVCLYRDDEFYLSKRRDEAGGVEIGICLKKCEMDLFLSFFENGLKN